MSYTIVVQASQELSEYYQFLLQGQYDFAIVVLADGQKALDYIKENGEPHCFILGSRSKDFLNVLKDYDSKEVRYPLIVTCKKSEEAFVVAKFKTSALSRLIHEEESIDVLFDQMQKLFAMGQRKLQAQTYCKVNIDFFKNTEELFCDVFVRLTDNKYVKIIDRYQPIEPDLIERYVVRNVRHLFVKANDFKLITAQLMKKISPNTQTCASPMERSKALIAAPPSSIIFPIQLQETVYESINKIGLNEQAVEMASMAISSTIELIEKNQVAFEQLSKYLKKGDYLSSHSFFLSYLSCSILRETPWKSPSASTKLTLAAFFHDISLEDSDIAKLHDLEKYSSKDIEYSVEQKVKEHTMASVKLMSKIEGIPNDVDKIILQHHEDYSGLGYPRGIDYKHFTPLAAVFKVAHELSNRLYIQGMDQEVIASVIEEMRQDYKSHPFSIVIQGLDKCFPKNQKMVG